MKRLVAPLAVGLAALYLVLAMGAAGCLFLHGEPSAHHHNPSHVTHSALCAWACQVNPTVATVSSAPSATILAFVSLSGLSGPTFMAHAAAAVSLARAPPRSLLL